MAEVFEKRLKYVGNDLEIWETAKIFMKCHRYMVLVLSMERHQYVKNDLIIFNMSQICGNGRRILETDLVCWKWLKNLTNGLNIWEMTHICGKLLKY